MVDLQKLQFRFEHTGPVGYPEPEHALYAYEGSTENHNNFRGMISWNQQSGEIGYVHTGPLVRQPGGHDDYRRQGVATALLHQAQFESVQRGLAAPQHSDDLTEDGAKFVQARPLQ